MDEFSKFNLIEGTFWILLGIISFILKRKMPQKYSGIAHLSMWVFILFGISDYVEVQMGGFLYPTIWWLLIWKIGCVIGMVIGVVWYLRLRLKR